MAGAGERGGRNRVFQAAPGQLALPSRELAKLSLQTGGDITKVKSAMVSSIDDGGISAAATST